MVRKEYSFASYGASARATAAYCRATRPYLVPLFARRLAHAYPKAQRRDVLAIKFEALIRAVVEALKYDGAFLEPEHDSQVAVEAAIDDRVDHVKLVCVERGQSVGHPGRDVGGHDVHQLVCHFSSLVTAPNGWLPPMLGRFIVSFV
jgi:hypothetical protein